MPRWVADPPRRELRRARCVKNTLRAQEANRHPAISRQKNRQPASHKPQGNRNTSEIERLLASCAQQMFRLANDDDGVANH